MQREYRVIPLACALAAGLALLAPAQATVSVTGSSFSYTQSFDSLVASGTPPAWVNDSTVEGWSLYTAAGSAIGSYLVGNGGSNAGSFYSFGSGTASDRALGSTASGGTYFGSPTSGAVAGYIVAAFTNNSGSALTGFKLAFDGEQWRNGGNTSAQSLTLQWGLGASYAAVAWTSASGFDFTSPIHTASAAALDGNALANGAHLSGSVSTPWATGQTLWLRWADTNDVGNDHGLALDNVQLSVTAVPEPAQIGLLLAGLPLVWGLTRQRRRRD